MYDLSQGLWARKPRETMAPAQPPTIRHHIFLAFLPSFVKKNLNLTFNGTAFKKQETFVESVVKIVDVD
jgi:hypothetical protein